MSILSALKKGNELSSEKARVSFASSQLILFQSRKKWGLLYSLATVVGLFCVPGILGTIAGTEVLPLAWSMAPLPVISLLVAVGMYILNDLVDSDLDRANGKNRPIPSGQVSKRQAQAFILLTNGTALALSILVNTASAIIIVPMLAIGIMYSAPKIALMNRFVIKTLSIALFYMLCAVLGFTSAYGFELAAASPAVPLHAMAMLGIMIFISSTLNDLGDVEGDRAAGRRTIPIVLNTKNTIKMTIALAAGMAASSWLLYGSSGLGLATAVITSLFALLVAERMAKMHGALADMEFMRRQHKKLFPLHMVLQAGLVAGTLLL